MTREEIRTRILHGLNESATDPVFWTPDEVNDLLDEGAEVVCEEAGAVKRTAYVAIESARRYYNIAHIAPDVMAPWRLTLPYLHRRLDAVSLATLDARNQTWQQTQGDPLCWFPVSWDTFGVWPVPAADGGVIQVEYLAWPRALLDDDDVPELLETDQGALVLYGVYDGLAKRWDAKGCVDAWAEFNVGLNDARARTGVRRIQSRVQQRDGGTVVGGRTLP